MHVSVIRRPPPSLTGVCGPGSRLDETEPLPVGRRKGKEVCHGDDVR